MAHSLPFIAWDEATHKYVVNEDAAKYLSGFTDKIGAWPVGAQRPMQRVEVTACVPHAARRRRPPDRACPRSLQPSSSSLADTAAGSRS